MNRVVARSSDANGRATRARETGGEAWGPAGATGLARPSFARTGLGSTRTTGGSIDRRSETAGSIGGRMGSLDGIGLGDVSGGRRSGSAARGSSIRATGGV